VATTEDQSLTLSCNDQCFPGISTFIYPKKNIKCVLIFPPYHSANRVSHSRSYCEPFFKQAESKNICSKKLIDPGTIRGAETLRDLTFTVSDMEYTGSLCDSNRWMAANHPEIAVKNPDNYSVRR
jgi:hypothetical protein